MPSSLLPVLWICGAPGAGKSVTAWRLFESMATDGGTFAYLDIDQIGMLYPESASDPERYRLKTDALNAVIPHYAAAGAQALIVSGIVDPAAARDLARQHPDAQVTFCLLDAGETRLRDRLTQRAWDGEDVDEAVTEARELAQAGFVDASIDTSACGVPEAADRARTFLSTRPSGEAASVDPHPRSGADADLVVVTGPRAVGTSTIGFGLARSRWSSGVTTGFVDLDQLSFLRSPDHHADRAVRARLGSANVTALHDLFATLGATSLVVSAHLQDAGQHATLRRGAPRAAVRIVRLRADEETLARHVRERVVASAARLAGDDLLDAPRHRQREVVSQALRDQQDLDAQVDQDTLIDVSGRSVQSVVDEVAMAQRRGR